MTAATGRLTARLMLLTLVLVGGAFLRGALIPAHRADLAPEAHNWRLRLPWSPAAEVTVAFPAPEDGLWATVRRTVAEATPMAALQELAAGPAPGSPLRPPLPAGAVVTAVAVDANGAATVTLSGWDPDPADPGVALALEAMARTLTAVAAGPSGAAEPIPVGSVRAVTPSGRTLGPVPAPDSGAGVTYLWRGQPVKLPAGLPGGPDAPLAAVKRLLTGPAPAGADGAAGSGVRALAVTVKGDTALVALDLSPGIMTELMAGRWQFAPHAMAVVYTLTDLPGIRRVQFDFPNLPPEARRQCRTPLGVPLVRPEAEAGLAKGGSQ